MDFAERGAYAKLSKICRFNIRISSGSDLVGARHACQGDSIVPGCLVKIPQTWKYTMQVHRLTQYIGMSFVSKMFCYD